MVQRQISSGVTSCAAFCGVLGELRDDMNTISLLLLALTVQIQAQAHLLIASCFGFLEIVPFKKTIVYS